MIKEIRHNFNTHFNELKYLDYLKKIEELSPNTLDFRIAETPIFIPKEFTTKMLNTCDKIIDVIIDKNFINLTERSIPTLEKVANQNNHSHFIAFDFGICINDKGDIEPQLIEMQGFPTLFAFQPLHSEITATYADVPNQFSAYLNGYNKATYFDLLNNIIVGDTNKENVILLEIYPEKQKTKIDFDCTEKILGIKTICITKLIAEGDKLYYINNEKKIRIKKIYNRLIFDDLLKHEELKNILDLTKQYDVEWVPHPNWFYRISKFTLPFIENDYVPKTYFLNQLKSIPDDLENYVLKPLFSFAGMGVIIDVTKQDINNITDPENWILQRKVKYADIIETPDMPAKAEIRLFYFWKDGWTKPKAVHNLARLSKGKMIGTRYNKDMDWVGGSVAFFEN